MCCEILSRTFFSSLTVLVTVPIPIRLIWKDAMSKKIQPYTILTTKANTSMKVVIIVLSLLITFLENSYAAPNKEEDILQEKCSKGAGEFYKNKFEAGFEKGSTSYISHYNKKLNKCFVSIFIRGYLKNNAKMDSINILLYDINESKELGSLFQVFGDPQEEMPDCIFLRKPVVKCSRDDWDAFIKPYFQE